MKECSELNDTYMDFCFFSIGSAIMAHYYNFTDDANQECKSLYMEGKNYEDICLHGLSWEVGLNYNESILNIWKKTSYKRIRKNLRKGIVELDICKKCMGINT